ncbi:phage late control D family protein [Sediminimonas qiaohouensis]|uniref:phage late control D family protein n=1 Tax=Sediminimonas qiaohouensis TaxID=552061 RepID=UPI0004151C89|nr:contractile injection system protein, VgrG/Pvc8 family [Sediminimonas qiaohouensis]
MRPQCRITVDGQPVAGLFMDRLISCSVTDKEGASSDTVDILLNDWPVAAIPRRGAEIRVWMGYAGTLAFMGTFEAEEIEVEILPYRMRITGKAAEMRGDKKSNKERHWDNKSVKEIVEAIAGEHGLTPKIDDAVAAHVYEWVGQVGESNLHFLERLAERHGALFSIKDGNLIFAARGQGKSPSGRALTPVAITPETLIVGTCRVRLTERAKYKKIKGKYPDRAAGKQEEIEAESDPDGEAIFKIDFPFADKKEAEKAVIAKAKELKRRKAAMSCRVVGNPAVRAGAPVVLSQCRPEIDGMRFIIETATHEYSGSGYTTAIAAQLGDDEDSFDEEENSEEFQFAPDGFTES